MNSKFLILIILSIFNNISEDEDYVPIIGTFIKKANKPVALLKASKHIVGNTFGSIFGKASSLWSSTSSSKKNKKGIKRK